MWINLKHSTLTMMEDAGDARIISRWDTLDRAKSYYNSLKGTYSGYIHPNPSNALATPVYVLKLGAKEGEFNE